MWVAGCLYTAAMVTALFVAFHLKGIAVWLGVGFPILVAVLIAVSAFSLIVRRLHDRDKDWWWALVYVGVPIILNLVFLAYPETLAGLGLAVVAAFISLIWFVEAYFLRGTIGENRFGRDPVDFGVVHPSAKNA